MNDYNIKKSSFSLSKPILNFNWNPKLFLIKQIEIVIRKINYKCNVISETCKLHCIFLLKWPLPNLRQQNS